MSWKGMDLVIRLVADLKRYRADLRDAGRDTQQAMAQAKASTEGLTQAHRGLEGQAGRTARQLVDAGRAAANGDFASAGQQAAGMAANMGRAGAAAGGLGTMLGIAAAAVGAYVLVSYKASAEFERQANLMALTGNAAGLLAGDMNAMARRSAEAAHGTVGDAREITEALIGTGKFGKAATESVASAIERVAQASGDSREQVTADFSKMADGVVKWAVEHNERYHFLTVDQYRYIKALDEAGQKQQAMIVVGDAFKKHLAGIEENVGTLQRAWRGLGSMASWAWDQMLNIGRAETSQDALDTVSKRVQKMRDQLAYHQSRGATGAAERDQKLLDVWLQQQALLQENLRLERRSADAKAASAQATADQIAKEEEAANAKNRHHTSTKKLTEAEKELAEQRKRDLAVGELRNKLAGDAYKDAQAAAKASAEVEAFFRQQEIDAQRRWDDQAKKEAEAKQKAMDKLREDELRAWEKSWEQVSQSFTDALMEGGRSVRDYLAGLFRTLVLRPVLAPLGAGLAGVMGGGSAFAGSGGVAGGVGGGGLSSLGSLGSFMGEAGGLLGALGTGLGAGFSSIASAGLGGWLSAGTSLIGTGSLAGILSGAGMLLGPIGLVASLLGGDLLGGLFGSKFTGTDLEASLAGTDSVKLGFRDYYKGGMFSSDSNSYRSADQAQTDQFATTYTAMTSLAIEQAQALGIESAESLLDGFRWQIKFNTKDMSEEEVAQRVADEFAKAADAQAKLLMGTSEYVREGESASEALTRLSSSLTVVNSVFDTLGETAYATGLAGADMASQLADAFGGLDAFTSAATAYYQAFYSEEERLATTTRQVSEALAELGYDMPGTRDGFRALVEAQDLTTEAGRSTYATLLGLAPAFAEVTQAMEQMGAALDDEVSRLRGLLTTDSTSSMAALQAQFATQTAMARAGDATALERLPQLSQDIEAAAALQAVTAADVALMRGQLAASLEETMRALGLEVPAFSVGTNRVPRDMLAMVHEGEAIVPKAFNPAAGGVAPGGDAMVAELRAVRGELEGLRAEVRSGVTHGAKTARILDRVARDGDAFLTVAA